MTLNRGPRLGARQASEGARSCRSTAPSAPLTSVDARTTLRRRARVSAAHRPPTTLQAERWDEMGRNTVSIKVKFTGLTQSSQVYPAVMFD